jgi:hypothetical protein
MRVNESVVGVSLPWDADGKGCCEVCMFCLSCFLFIIFLNVYVIDRSDAVLDYKQ